MIKNECKAQVLDMFGTFVHPLQEELGIKSNHRVGRFPQRQNANFPLLDDATWHEGGQLCADSRRLRAPHVAPCALAAKDKNLWSRH